MERIKLNLIPSGVAPVVHCSQYDKGRKFAIDLFEGDSVYTLTGTETLSVNVRKPDGHLVTEAVVNTSSTYVEVTTTEQMVAVSGTNYAKLKIVKGAVTIATLEFLMNVSRDPLENGDPSESFVHDLATQIASGVATEVASQYDSANVLFDNVPTAGHGIGYAVTSEGVKSVTPKYYTTSIYKLNDLAWVTTGGGIYRAVITLSDLPIGAKILAITIYNFAAISINYNFMPYINVDADRQIGIMSNYNAFGNDSALAFRVIYI